MAVKVPSNLPELVKSAFNKARANGDVNFYPTQVTLLHINSVPFQLRFSPSLANKPKSSSPAPTSGPCLSRIPPTATDQTKPVFDPFDNPSPQLLVSSIPPSHILVLNKFAIVPEHFILATKEFKPQTDLLEEDDLEAAHKCIEVYRERGEELFAFFNGGNGSGASQPHRHLQFLVAGRMRDGLPLLERDQVGDVGSGVAPQVGPEVDGFANAPDASDDAIPDSVSPRKNDVYPGSKKDGAVQEGQLEGARDAENGGWDVLARRLDDETVRGLLPFRVFTRNVEGMDGSQLKETYMSLYLQACDALGVQHVQGTETRISYNLALTDKLMVVMPRAVEGDEVRDANGVAGKLALNGTVLAGTALVKTQREWDALRQDPGQVLNILKRIGVPNEIGDNI